MTSRTRALLAVTVLSLLAARPATAGDDAARAAMQPDTVLYGAAYYHE